jgi:hypothetical protein
MERYLKCLSLVFNSLRHCSQHWLWGQQLAKSLSFFLLFVVGHYYSFLVVIVASIVEAAIHILEVCLMSLQAHQ